MLERVILPRVRAAKRRALRSWRRSLVLEDLRVEPLWTRPATFPPGQNVILTSYFSKHADPQTGHTVPSDNLALVERWAGGIEANALHGVIFHDNLSDDFCHSIASRFHDHISFAKCPAPRIMSYNEYRFVAYLQWLSKNPSPAVFPVDLFDVVIKMSPFSLLDAEHELWASHEKQTIDSGTPEGLWMVDRFRRAFGQTPPPLQGKRILNAGVWGGHYGPVLRALLLLQDHFVAAYTAGDAIEEPILAPMIGRSVYNYDMAVFNYVIRAEFSEDQIWERGLPLHSEFKKYEMNAEACFIHK